MFRRARHPPTNHYETRQGGQCRNLPNEVRVRRVERGHERVKLPLELLRDGVPRCHHTLPGRRRGAPPPLGAPVSLLITKTQDTDQQCRSRMLCEEVASNATQKPYRRYYRSNRWTLDTDG